MLRHHCVVFVVGALVQSLVSCRAPRAPVLETPVTTARVAIQTPDDVATAENSALASTAHVAGGDGRFTILASALVHGGYDEWILGVPVSGIARSGDAELLFKFDRTSADVCWPPQTAKEGVAAWVAALPFPLASSSLHLGSLMELRMGEHELTVFLVEPDVICPAENIKLAWVGFDADTQELRAALFSWMGEQILMIRSDYCCAGTAWLPRQVDAFRWNWKYFSPGDLLWTVRLQFDEVPSQRDAPVYDGSGELEFFLPADGDGRVRLLSERVAGGP